MKGRYKQQRQTKTVGRQGRKGGEEKGKEKVYSKSSWKKAQ